MPEDISVVRKCIIEEYLSNWFTYEELAEYLCIDVSLVKHTLDQFVEYDKNLSSKVQRHRGYIQDYLAIEMLGKQ